MLKQYGPGLAKVLLASLLAGAGAAKLMGLPEVHLSFAVLGLPVWFGYFVGASEVALAIALFVGPLCRFAAIAAAILLCGAIYYHLAHTPAVEAATAAIGLLLSLGLLVAERRGPAQ